MKLYFWLSKIPFLKNSYSNKFLFVAFLGIHIPLIGLIFTIVFSEQQYSHWTIIFFTLLLTLVATLATLIVIHKLITPISLASKSLIDYRLNRTLPQLPTHFTDESGLLMSNIQHTINENEIYLQQKQNVIYLLTHDIKNFAAQPMVLADLILEDEKLSHTTKEYLHLIKESSTKQLTFLEGFLKLLHAENEIASYEAAENKVNINEIINSVQDELKEKFAEKNISLSVDAEMNEITLQNKEILLLRILSNLIMNAIKFSYRNSEIQLKITQAEGYVEIVVKDDGIGFDNSKKQQLFEKFTAMGRSGTANEVSTGIGLHLCKQMVEKLHGSIDAFSEGENKGAVFTIILKEFAS